jgi:very-short-patch-repair endonuclease
MTKQLTTLAKELRQRETKAEAVLWRRLRTRQMEHMKFRRQQPIDNYIVDFVSFEKRIVIELDGGHHANERQKDERRDRILKKNGFRVLRFWSHEIFENLGGVLEVIRRECLK